ncbi:MAG: helix-turn-helix domain-containing protein [Alphaproteobacteria bacterium]|nr:helix-turn-helix domain-containing protein [Alphaproteobacteria bacterium]
MGSWKSCSEPPSLNCMKIEKATRGHVKKEDIRPDFDWKKFKLI